MSGNPPDKTYEIIAENANPRLTTPIGGSPFRAVTPNQDYSVPLMSKIGSRVTGRNRIAV
jgi:hypothetical protein